MKGFSLLQLRHNLSNTFYDCLFSFWHVTLKSCLCKSVKFILGLAISMRYVNFKVVSVLTPFFTNNWKEHTLLEAAILSNVRDSSSRLTLILLTCISTAYGSRREVVILTSSCVLIFGLVLLYLTTDQIIPQNLLFYTIAVSVIGIGKAGSEPLLIDFFKGQLASHDVGEEEAVKEDTGRVQTRFNMWNAIALMVLLVIIYLPVHGWKEKLIVSASMLAVSCIIFLSGTSSYHPIQPITNPLIVMKQVLWAAFLKRSLRYPLTPDQFLCNEGNHLLLPVGIARCLDKAAIIEHSDVDINSDLEQQQQEQGRLCTATQVQETKLLLTMIPIWVIVSIGYGMLQTTGTTFFSEQANNMQPQIGITYLLIFQSVISGWASGFCRSHLKRISKEKRRCHRILRIVLGSIMYTLCFVCAREVEVHKSRVVEKKGLLLNPDDKIPISTWMLLPQFFFSGCAKGLAMRGVVEFYKHQVPKSMESYADALNSFFSGIGSILSLFCLLKYRSFFGKSLNSSRLDRYYMFIIQFSTIHFFVTFGVLVWIYLYKYINIISDETNLESNLEPQVLGKINDHTFEQEADQLQTEVVDVLGINLPDDQDTEATRQDLEQQPLRVG